MIEKTIFYKGSTIYYTVTGHGPRVILLHGFGETGEIWKNQIPFLSTAFQLIIPDIPGSGRSEIINNATIETYADVIKDIIDEEIKNIHHADKKAAAPKKEAAGYTLIGHSMGGYIAMAFAEKYPDNIKGLGLFHSSAFADTEEKKELRKKAMDFITSNGVFNFLKSSIPGLFTKTYVSNHEKEVESLIKEGEKFSKASLIQYYTAMSNRPDRRKVLENFKGPVLFLAGEWDTAIPLQISLQQAHLPTQSYIIILDSSAHMGLWEEVEKTNKILFKFLSCI